MCDLNGMYIINKNKNKTAWLYLPMMFTAKEQVTVLPLGSVASQVTVNSPMLKDVPDSRLHSTLVPFPELSVTSGGDHVTMAVAPPGVVSRSTSAGHKVKMGASMSTNNKF